MPFSIEVPATFKFHDDEALLLVNGSTLNLNKIESLAEWRMTLFAIASQSLATIVQDRVRTAAGPSPAKTTVEPTAKQEPVASVDQSMQRTGEEFQRQHDDILARTQKLRDELVAQYNDLASTHASTLESINRAADKSIPQNG